jgi:hypothetical protein
VSQKQKNWKGHLEEKYMNKGKERRKKEKNATKNIQFYARFFLVLFFNPEDGDDTLLRNVG